MQAQANNAQERDESNAEQQAKAQANSIAAMVAALNVDYDRLEELEDERESLEYDINEANESGDKVAFHVAQKALADWEEANKEELAELEEAANGNESEDDAREAIEQDALDVQVRSDWHSPGSADDNKPSEFQILLCTGGPAVRIVGELNGYAEPSRAWLEYQDWGTPWTQAFNVIEQSTLLQYCQQFYFGE